MMTFKIKELIKMVNKLVEFCKANIDLSQKSYAESYKSMSECLIDCVYSLRAKYFAVTVPVVNRYADKYMNGDSHAADDDLEDLIKHIDEAGGCEVFARDILKNMQVLGGLRKSEVVYRLAKVLLRLGINTMEDFKNFEDLDLLECMIHSVHGMGDAGTDYLVMLAGSDDRCKVDVHIHECVIDALGYDLNTKECQQLMKDAVNILKKEYSHLTVKQLDGLIWFKYQNK